MSPFLYRRNPVRSTRLGEKRKNIGSVCLRSHPTAWKQGTGARRKGTNESTVKLRFRQTGAIIKKLIEPANFLSFSEDFQYGFEEPL